MGTRRTRIFRIAADFFSERDVNGNAEYADFSDARGFFPSVTLMATRSTRIFRMPADFSERDVNGNAEYAGFRIAADFSERDVNGNTEYTDFADGCGLGFSGSGFCFGW
jgi:hypothetical protein